MRLLGLSLLVVCGALAACAGPADPSAPPMVYRTGSLIKQPDVAQPDMSYYGRTELNRSPDQSVTGAIRHSPATPVPPPPESAPQ